jgi:hypothetical protein
MSDDDPTIPLRAPLPDEHLEGTLTWRAARGGLRPGDEDVPRTRATHAELRTVVLGGREHRRRLTREEADAYLREVAALHAEVERFDATAADRRAAHDRQRAELAATIDLTCPRCAVPRAYAGRRNLLSAAAPEHVAREDEWQRMRPEVVGYDEYRCPHCGSVELFAAGALAPPA